MDLAGNKTLTLVVAMLGGVIEKCSTRVLELIFDIENAKTAVRSRQRLVDLKLARFAFSQLSSDNRVDAAVIHYLS